MKLNRVLGNVDVPILESLSVSLSGTSAFKHPIWIVPDLSKLASEAKVNARPQNALRVRSVYIVPEASYTGVVTNNWTIKAVQNRGGSPLNILASLTLDNTVPLTALVAKLMDPGLATPQLLPGDVVTFEMVANGTGGGGPLALTVFIDLEGPAKNS